MWQDKLKEIIYILENSKINEIEVNFWGRKYRVVKNANIMVQNESAPQIQSSNASTKDKNTPLAESEVSETVPPASLEGEELLSPMPGTFYSAPTPDDPKFVNVGDKVNKGQTLCIIEAMKIMNEIESEFEGTVTDIKVNNGEAVEYSQPLFIINPT